MEEKRMIEILKLQLGLNITTDIVEFDKVDCTVYSESTADGYDVYIVTNDSKSPHICEDVYYYDHDIAERISEQIRWGDTSFYIDDCLYEDCYIEDKLIEMFTETVEDIVKGDVITEAQAGWAVQMADEFVQIMQRTIIDK